MNNHDFKQHFIHICAKLNIEDARDRHYTVCPVIEDNGKYSSADDMMRLLFLPRPRTCTFEGVLKLFTWKEGYYPLWIEILCADGEVVLRTSLRMRKAGGNDDGEFYPFRLPPAH